VDERLSEGDLVIEADGDWVFVDVFVPEGEMEGDRDGDGVFVSDDVVDPLRVAEGEEVRDGEEDGERDNDLVEVGEIEIEGVGEGVLV